MTIKTIFILLTAFLFLSCGHQDEKKEISTTPASELVIDSFPEKTKTEASTEPWKKETTSSYQKRLNSILADTTIKEYFKEIYRQEKLIRADERKMLTITEKIFTDDPDKQLFYFIVFTKSMNESDGFYSEALGLASFEFVTTKTERFAEYFCIAPKLTDLDLENWARFVCAEIYITNEGQEEKAIKKLEARLSDNIRTNQIEHKSVIERFIEMLKVRCQS